MGMDLKPVNPGPDHPKDEKGNPVWGRYNISGWARLWNMLNDAGVDTSEFSGMNDGDPISDATCKEVADALEKLLPTIRAQAEAVYDEHKAAAEAKPEPMRALLMPNTVDETMEEWTKDIHMWRTCGGYLQY